jgi:hypothetical protein
MSADENTSLPDGGDSLDQLLGEARWPATPQTTIARLAQHWEGIRAARRRRELLTRRAAALAVAASLLGAMTIGWFHLRSRKTAIVEIVLPPTNSLGQSPAAVEHRSVITRSPQSVDTSRYETRRPSVTAQTAVIDPPNRNSPSADLRTDLVPSRPPNELEELMLTAADRNRKHSSISARAAGPSTKHGAAPASLVRSSGKGRHRSSLATDAKSAEAAIVAAAVKRLVSDSKADVASVSAQVRTTAPKYEAVLLATLDRGKAPEQIAALRLLAEIGTAAAVGPTLRAVTVPELHRAAIDTVVRIADSSVVCELALGEQNAELQRRLLASLLSRDEPVSLAQFLNFVVNDGTAEAALAAAQSLRNPPMDLLFSSLSDSLEARRIAAARVIGRIDGDATTRRLIAMVESGVNRHEACIALLSSRGREAVRYVRIAAERDPTLTGVLSGARLFTSSDISPRS